MLAHSCDIVTALPDWAVPLRGLGHRGVQLFYLLSAYMLCRSIAQRREQESRPWEGFFIRRLLRIAPLFWLAIGVHLWCYGLGPRHSLGDAPGITWQNIVATATFTHGFNPYWIDSVVFGGWSVAVEMSFYLLLPIFWMCIRSLRMAVFATLGALLLALVLQIALADRPVISDPVLWREYLFLWLPNQLPVFLLGMVLFFLEPILQAGQPDRLGPIGPLLPHVCFAAIVVLAWLPFHPVLTPFLVGVGFTGLAGALSVWPSGLWANRFLSRLGLVSYSIYLWHAPLIRLLWAVYHKVLQRTHWILPAGLSQLLFSGMLLGLSLAVGSLSYRYIEQPGIELGRRLIRHRQARRTRQAQTKEQAGAAGLAQPADNAEA